MDEKDDEILAVKTIDNKETLRRSLAGGHWYLINMVSQKMFAFGTFFITARLLTPADFGIITLAGIYPALADSFTAIAFETALIPLKSGKEKPFLNSVWTFQILRGFAIAILVFFSAPLVVKFFNAEENILLFQLSALPLIFNGFSNIGQIYFSRNLDFKKFFIRDFIIQSTTSIISVAGALTFHSYWALFAGNTTALLFAALSTYVLNDYRPHIDMRFSKLKPLLSYGSWLYGQEILHQIALTAENVLIGRFAGASNIGLYTKAKGLAQAPSSIVASIIGKVGFSTFAAIHDSLAYVREGFYKSTDLLVVISLPFLAAILVAGEHIVSILLGSRWLDMGFILKIIVIPATLDAIISSLARPIFNALNKPRLHFNLNIVYSGGFTLLLLLLVPPFGIIGAAWALLLSSLITNTFALTLVHKLIAPSWKRILESVSIVGLGIIVPLPFALYFLQYPFANSTTGFLLLVCLSGIIYGSTIVFFGRVLNKGPYQTLVVIAKSFKRIP